MMSARLLQQFFFVDKINYSNEMIISWPAYINLAQTLEPVCDEIKICQQDQKRYLLKFEHRDETKSITTHVP